MPLKFFVCRNHNPIIFPFMTYNRVSNNYNMMVATCGVATAYPSGAPEPTPGF